MTVEEKSPLHETVWETRGQKPLTLSERETLIARHLGDRRSDTNGSLLMRLAEDNRSRSPLFLRTILEELRRADDETLAERAETLIAAQTPEALFDRVLSNLEQDFDSDSVHSVVCSIAASRGGYSREELHAVLGVQPPALDPLITALSPHLLGFAGKYTVMHAPFRTAAANRYFDGEQSGVHACLAKKLQVLPVSNPLRLEEPWQWKRSGDRDALCASLEDRDLFTRLMEFENQGDLLTYWSMLGDRRSNFIAVGNRRIGRVRGKVTEAQLTPLVTFVRFCILVTQFASVEKSIARLLGAAEASGLKGSVQWWWLKLSLVDLYNLTGAHDRSELYIDTLLDLAGREDVDITMRIQSIERLGTIFFNTYRFDEAEKFFIEQIDLCSKAYGHADTRLAGSYSNLAGCCYRQQRRNEASALWSRADESWQRARRDDPRRADVLNNLAVSRFKEDPRGSAELLDRAIELVRVAYGPDTSHAIGYLINRARFLSEADREKSTASLDEALVLAEAIGDETSISRIHSYYGYFALDRQDYEASKRHFLQSYEIRERLYGADHTLTKDVLGKLGEIEVAEEAAYGSSTEAA